MKTPLVVLSIVLISSSLFSCQKEPQEECEVITDTVTIIKTDTITLTNVKLKEGLVAWYKFDGNLGDSSGQGNHAVNIAGAGAIGFTTDKSGKASGAVSMDGIDDIIIADDRGSLVTPTSVTISAYYNTSSTETQNLVCKRNQYVATTEPEFGGLAWSINASSTNEPHFAVISPVGATCGTPRGIDAFEDIVFAMQKIIPNQWYHIVCVFHEGSQRIYLNGRLRQATTRQFVTMRQCPGGKLVIGGFVDDLPTRFKGSIDDLRVYNRLLNSAEIAELAKGY
jgi:arabinan endo-1,5-alpha-L-arabinosidase